MRQCVRDLDAWLDDTAASGLGPFMSLARAFGPTEQEDARLTLRWSTGPVEGHVTRVKSVSSDDLDQRFSNGCSTIRPRWGGDQVKQTNWY